MQEKHAQIFDNVQESELEGSVKNPDYKILQEF
jgi:hypothetical protein